MEHSQSLALDGCDMVRRIIPIIAERCVTSRVFQNRDFKSNPYFRRPNPVGLDIGRQDLTGSDT